MNQVLAPTITIGRRTIGVGFPSYLIAEIGSNHNGSLETATQLVRLCAEAGADAVKFQAYSRDTLFIERLPEDGTEERRRNQRLLAKRWGILPKTTVPEEWWPDLMSFCAESGVDFLCTPFDLQRLQHLVALGMRAVKVASGDITWLEMLRAAAQTGRPVMFSTGAASLKETERALAVLQENGTGQAAVLHCVSNYPPRWEDVNLRAMESLRRSFQLPVGLSDHSPGSMLPIAAVAMGASIIEKHVTLDRSQEGLDHHFALEVDEFARMVEDVRNVEAALGSGRKTWAPDEEIERYWVRRGLWCRTSIGKGEKITREMLRVVRPAQGAGAELLDNVIGRTATRDLDAGDPLEVDCVK